MLKFKKFIFILAIVVFLIFGFFFVFQKSYDLKAQAVSNVWGWAWNPGIGWISFSSDNTNATINYGVNINEGNGELSGYAWINPYDDSANTSNIGWLSFNKSETGIPPAPPFDNNDQNYIAQLDLNETSPSYNQLLGWARFLGLKDKGTGWVKFSGSDIIYNYSYNGVLNTKPSYNKCECDTGDAKECPDSFLTNPSAPDFCYDEEKYTIPAYALYPSSTISVIGYRFDELDRVLDYAEPRADCDTTWQYRECPSSFYQASTANYLFDQTYYGPFFSIRFRRTNIGKFQYNYTSTSTSANGYSQAPFDTNNLQLDTCSPNTEVPCPFFESIEVYDGNSFLPFNSYYDSYQELLTKYHIYKKTQQSGINYGVLRNGCKLEGYAWSEDFGWIHFNGTNYGVLTSVCPPSPPDVKPNDDSLSGFENGVNQGDYCTLPLQPTFGWIFSDPNSNDRQTAYQIQISTSDTFSTSTIVYDTDKIQSDSNTYRVSAPPNGLDYNTTYYWRIKVWDTTDLASDWATSSFTTLEKKPIVDFTWNPLSPNINQEVEFINNTDTEGVSGLFQFYWYFGEDPNYGTPSSTVTYDVSSTATSSFKTSGSYNITLSESNSKCTKIKTLNVNAPLPKWREILPKILP